jgi:hypothetical protein
MIKNQRILRLTTLLLCCGLQAAAQEPELFTAMKKKYPDQQAVYLSRSRTVSFFYKGDSLQAQEVFEEELLILKNITENFIRSKVYGSSLTPVSGIVAKTLVWDGRKYREQEVKSFQKTSEADEGIFFDDSYQYTFNFPSVNPGNRTYLRYTNTYKDVRFLPAYIVSNYYPQEVTKYTIKCPKEITLHYEILHDRSNVITSSSYEKSGNTFFEWGATNVKPQKFEENSPSINYYAPHVVAFVQAYQQSGKTIHLLKDLTSLYQWYTTFVKDLPKEPSEQLKLKVQEITKNTTSDLEKAKAIFYWVQENIKYIAFEQGMRGLIPHPGSYVYEKRFGDCKDMSSLLVSMLTSANLKAYYTWIGTRDIPYQYSQFPTPLVDNHMIATYVSPDNKFYFLDATSKHTAFGTPSSMIQGKEALVGISDKEFVIKKVPEMPRESNTIIDSIWLQISNTLLYGRGQMLLAGYPKVFSGYQFNREVNDAKKNYVTRLVGKGSNKFILQDYKLTNLTAHEIPSKVSYEFQVGDYVKKIGDELYVNLCLSRPYYNQYLEIDRQTPRENDYRFVHNEYYELTIPKGYEIEYLPQNAKHEGNLLGFEFSYTSTVDKVVLNKKIYIDYLLLQPDHIKDWNLSINKISEAYQESIILKLKK